MKKILRNPWPFAIISYFVVFIGTTAALVTWAARQKMDLVQEDYYDKEIKFQDQIDAGIRAHAITGQVTIAYDAASHKINLLLPHAQAHARVDGHVKLYRPSDAHLDLDFPLSMSEGGTQQIDAPKLSPGLWKAMISWESEGKSYYYADTLIVLVGKDL